jgi:hypothetical protein
VDSSPLAHIAMTFIFGRRLVGEHGIRNRIERSQSSLWRKRSGPYAFKCCHTSGLGHRGMKGQIIVGPAAM